MALYIGNKSGALSPIGAGIVKKTNGTGSLPTGAVVDFMGDFQQEGFLKCDGAIYNISDYPELANYFKEAFSVSNYFGGDGVTTFAVPDYHDEDIPSRLIPDATSNETADYKITSSGPHTNSGNFQEWFTFNSNKRGWCSTNITNPWIAYELKNGATFDVFNSYEFTSRNDTPSSDLEWLPHTWTLYGKKGDTWIELDSRSGTFFTGVAQTVRFRVANSKDTKGISGIKVVFTKENGANALGRIQLVNAKVVRASYIKY